jgi:hypothetical protein
MPLVCRVHTVGATPETHRRSLERNNRERGEQFFITPEAGPPPYMPTVPYTGKPVADARTVNVPMRDFLREPFGQTVKA